MPDQSSEKLQAILEDLKARLTSEELGKLGSMILSKRGGMKGGKARAAKLTAERKREIAVKAARARWEK